MFHVSPIPTILLLILGILYDDIEAEPIIGSNVKQERGNQFPYLVSILINGFFEDPDDESYVVCAGTLVSDRHVLTVAHCFTEDQEKSLIKVSVRSMNLQKYDQFSIHEIITYTDWAAQHNRVLENDDNDIAILTLDRRVEELHVRPATISRLKNEDLEGKKVTIVSWAVSESVLVPKVIEFGSAYVLSASTCVKEVKSRTETEFLMDNTRLCTSARPYLIMTCGDSGGPMLLKDMIVGINKGICPSDHVDSEVIPKAHKVNIHMSVYYYRDFIHDVIKRW
ncbi:hypothetical protein QAD02_023727 [Eretmocerus hayati]|uniref:Uncharacterized protein n=1 Tax=Eretmocerus hayati TaxID=131215 RepID=A0ACC2PX36_9HYME|nr:hypothetical protein QAD02_023727 [Eretmocerus hayati]